MSVRSPEQGALKRDVTFALLWGLRQEGWRAAGWVTSRAVYDRWLDGRDECGIAYASDYIGMPSAFTAHLNQLCADGRAEVSRAKGRHPLYRAIEPSLTLGPGSTQASH